MNAPPPVPPNVSPPARMGLAIASLVFGILAFLSSFFVVGALLGLVGFILGVAHFRRRQGRNGMAWAGTILSVLGVLVGIGAGALYFKIFTSPEFKEAFQSLTRPTPAVANDEFEKWTGVLAPDFSVTGLEGQTINLSELKGKRVVVDFWATWCPPCVMEIPHFIKLRSEAAMDDLVIVGISAEDADTLKAFVKKKGINYPIASADNLPAPYKEVGAIPTTFFIDRKGVIQNVFVGYHEFDELKAHALAGDFDGDLKAAPTPSSESAGETDKQP